MILNQERMEFLKERDGLTKTLGIEYISTPDPEVCVSRMKVTEANHQPWGYLSGGATLALAENTAGVGTMCLCPDRPCVGISVSAQHVRSVKLGGEVYAYARIIHQGNTLHTWLVEVKNPEGEIVSSIQVTNYLLKK